MKYVSKKVIKNLLYMIIGTIISALAINIFLTPAKISTGGASGVGVILFNLYKIPISLTVIALNIPLFIIALKNIGLKFSINAIIGTGLLSLMIQLTSPLSYAKWLNFSEDLFLSSIFGGILMGLGLALVFKGEGSTGGSDLLAQIIYKKRSTASIGQLLLLIDAVIVMLTIVAFKSALYGLYSIVALYIANKVIDIVFDGTNSSKAINIITKKPDEISDEIIKATDRGVTTSKCIGKYTEEEYTHVVTIVQNSQVQIVKRIVKEIDTKAFIYIYPSQEVLGTGFKEL